MKRALRSVAVIACSTLWSLATSAQPLDKDADAERLFREGQKLMEERRFGEACPKFEAAYRKDQQLGTLLNLAYCHKEQGAVWQSWLEFKEAEVKAADVKRPERKDFARERMAELEKSLVRVVVERSTKVELTEVLVEDRLIPEAEKGQPFAAEPGQRKLTFRAKGKKQVVQLITLTKGDRPHRVNVPEMEDERDSASGPMAVGSEHETPSSTDEPKRASTQKTVALVALGVGVVGVGVGSVFGLQTLSNECTDGKPTPGTTGGASCTSQQRDSASEKGAISTVAFVAGGTALVAGLVLWLTAPSGKPSTTTAQATYQSEKQVRSNVRLHPEIGAGWAGLRGIF